MSLQSGLILKFFSCHTCIAGKKPLGSKDVITAEVNGARLRTVKVQPCTHCLCRQAYDANKTKPNKCKCRTDAWKLQNVHETATSVG